MQVGSGLDGSGYFKDRKGDPSHEGHVEDMYSLAWSPCMKVMIGEEKYMEWLVASSSKGRTVMVGPSKESVAVHNMRLPQDNRTGGTAGLADWLIWAHSVQCVKCQ